MVKKYSKTTEEYLKRLKESQRKIFGNKKEETKIWIYKLKDYILEIFDSKKKDYYGSRRKWDGKIIINKPPTKSIEDKV